LKNIKATIALCGSLFMEEKLLERFVKKLSKEKFPYIKFIKPKRKPVWGAVEMARNLLRMRQKQSHGSLMGLLHHPDESG
jgi:hypothetical protein